MQLTTDQGSESGLITVISAGDRRRVGFFGCFVGLIRNLLASRELISVLFKRDFLAVYKKSFLGWTWLVITPLLSVVSWIFMYFTGVLHPGNLSVPYPAYVLASTSIWTLFVGFYTASAETLTSGSAFIMQVNYHHEVLLVKQIAQHLASSGISLAIMLTLIFAFGIHPSWGLLLFPLLIIPLAFLGAGIGLFVSVTGVVLQEFKKFMDVLMNLLIWVTPVIYSTNMNSALLKKVTHWNPLTYLVGGARDAIVFGRLTDLKFYFVSAALALLVFVISWRIFYLSEEHVIEKML